MIVYLVHIRKYTIKKNENNKRFYPIHTPKANSEILVEVSEKFPAAFQYWSLKPDDFINKTKVILFKNIKLMFAYFEKENIDIGTTFQSFYKQKKEVPDETPPEGVIIYSYKNIFVYALRVVS
ncbi:hypothetical protein ACS5NO_32285 [Larkinella sp. GY13]|uniref:hypothetical protein n=1 Tax=Larkinella sp. GY13 TaxID=3453720 RepID=UPI003EEC6E51